MIPPRVRIEQVSMEIPRPQLNFRYGHDRSSPNLYQPTKVKLELEFLDASEAAAFVARCEAIIAIQEENCGDEYPLERLPLLSRPR